MIKVLCIGDSLALPGHLNRYEDTWFYKIKMEYPEYDFISYFKRQLTTDVLTKMGGGEGGVDKWPKGADCLEAYAPDVVIVQLGIVDCAPRLLNRYDRAILKVLPNGLNKSYIKILKRIRKRKVENTTVSFEQFKNNWINYLNRAKQFDALVIILSIAIPDSTLINKNRDILVNVKKYNDYLLELCSLFTNIKIVHALNPQNFEKQIYEDGYHPSQFGHDVLSNRLISILG